MAIRTALWKVSSTPHVLVDAQLPSKKLLEDMIVAAPKVLSDEWLLMGRQESIGVGGIIDLRTVAPDGSFVPVELKHDRTPAKLSHRRSTTAAGSRCSNLKTSPQALAA